MSTLVALWNDAERAQPDKAALIAAEQRITYRQLGERIRRLAAHLAMSWNVRSGDVVALLAPNCPEFVMSYFAIVQLGATVQPVDERLNPEEIQALLLDSHTRTLIVHRSLWPKFAKVREGLSAVERILGIGIDTDRIEHWEDWITNGPGLQVNVALAPSNVAELMYTSGTTGQPKGVMRSHADVRAAARNSIRGFGYQSDDIIAIVMPLSHSSALNSQMMPLIELGATLVLQERFDVAQMLRVIRAEQVTCMRAVPAMLRSLLATPQFCSQELPSLRLLINSSAPIDPQTYRAIKGRFESIRVLNSYGLTEASTCTVLVDSQAVTRSDSVGVPIEGVEMVVRDREGHAVADGHEGEIHVRGEHVFSGYRNQPQATSAVLVDGWLHTGDLGRRDPDGFFYLLGRKDDVINCGGHKVMPIEVENCILQLPEVAEVAVVGHPHRTLGQVVKAIVVPKGNEAVQTKQIVRHCAQHLSTYKVPFYVELVSELPKNSVGKTLHRRLKEQTSEQ